MSGHTPFAAAFPASTAAALPVLPQGSRKRQRPTDNDTDDEMLDDEPINDELNTDGLDNDDMLDGEVTDDDVVYLETQEAYPPVAAYDKDFSQALEDTVQLLHQVGAVIPQHSRQHPRFKPLVQHIIRNSCVPEPRKRRVNIFGRSGSGKSSLVNSILGRPGLAKALSLGGGCTHVPTTYRCPFPGQQKPFAAATKFLESTKIVEMLKTLLQAYYLDRFGDLSDDDEEEKRRVKFESTTAFDAFRTLFCDRPEFGSVDAGRSFLDAAFELDRERLMETLLAWAKEVIKRLDSGTQHDTDSAADQLRFVEMDSQKELDEYMETFAFADSSYNAPRLWPLVDRVFQGLSDITILTYYELTDFPGIQDTNTLRDNASVDRIYENVDEIWLVSSVDRVATDPSLIRTLTRYADKIEVSLICTGADDGLMEYGLGKELKMNGVDIANFDELWDEEQALRSRTSKLRKSASVKNKKIRLSKQAAAMQALAIHEEKLRTVTLERFLLMYRCRQLHIDAQIRKSFSPHWSSVDKMKVFFVSNTHYTAVKTGMEVDGPQLTAEQTAVPSIRRWMLERASPGIVTAGKRFIENETATFMEGVKVSANLKNMEVLDQAVASVNDRVNRLQSFAQQHSRKVAEVIRQNLTEPLKAEHSTFCDHALSILDQKSQWNHRPIKAFVRKEGTHQTSTKPFHSWNEEFAKSFTSSVKKLWPEFLKNADAARTELGEALVEDFKGIFDELHQGEMQYGLEEQGLKNFIDGQAHNISHLCDTAWHEVFENFVAVQIHATQPDNGYFGNVMKKAYADARDITGKGCVNKMMCVFRIHLDMEYERSPFRIAAVDMEKEILEMIDACWKDLLEQVRAKFQDVGEWLAGAFHKGEDSEEEEVTKLLQKYYPQAKDTYDDIVSDLRRIERRYREKALVFENTMNIDGLEIKQEAKGKQKAQLEGESSEEDVRAQQQPPAANHGQDSNIEVLNMTDEQAIEQSRNVSQGAETLRCEATSHPTPGDLDAES